MRRSASRERRIATEMAAHSPLNNYMVMLSRNDPTRFSLDHQKYPLQIRLTHTMKSGLHRADHPAPQSRPARPVDPHVWG